MFITKFTFHASLTTTKHVHFANSFIKPPSPPNYIRTQQQQTHIIHGNNSVTCHILHHTALELCAETGRVELVHTGHNGVNCLIILQAK